MHRSDTANRMRCLIVLVRGFVDTVCSVSVVRNGSGIFAPASSRACGSKVAYAAHIFLETEGRRVLGLSRDDLLLQTRCAYEDFFCNGVQVDIM